jgi:hypothetical protein
MTRANPGRATALPGIRFYGHDHSFALPCLKNLFLLRCTFNSNNGNWRLPRVVLAKGHRRASIRVGSCCGPSTLCVCVCDALGEARRESGPIYSSVRSVLTSRGLRSLSQSRCRLLQSYEHPPFPKSLLPVAPTWTSCLSGSTCNGSPFPSNPSFRRLGAPRPAPRISTTPQAASATEP